jgi:hypothetical protein
MLRNTILLFVSLALATIGLLAQQSGTQATQAGQGTASPTSIEGCLHGSGGGFTLTDKSGTQYFLTGDKTSFESHNDQEVSVQGHSTSPVAQGMGGFPTSNTSTGTLPTFHVNSISKIADTCKQK